MFDLSYSVSKLLIYLVIRVLGRTSVLLGACPCPVLRSVLRNVVGSCLVVERAYRPDREAGKAYRLEAIRQSHAVEEGTACRQVVGKAYQPDFQQMGMEAFHDRQL